jgi:hypothetical protein
MRYSVPEWRGETLLRSLLKYELECVDRYDEKVG